MPKESVFKIKEIIPRTYNVKSLRVETDNLDFKAGQFICVTVNPQEPCSVYRFLSISSSPTEKGYIEFTKKITQSDFSKALDCLKPGDSVNIQLPAKGNFTLTDPNKKIAFLSGGIGITPIRSICKYVVDKNLGTDINLVYANRTIRDIVFKEDLDLMQRQYAKLKVAHVLCEPAPDFKCTIGLINAQVVKNEVSDYSERKFYICGPPSMVEAMQKILKEELGIMQENIVTEHFQGY
jgi:ferredoxin-NADP reductase